MMRDRNPPPVALALPRPPLARRIRNDLPLYLLLLPALVLAFVFVYVPLPGLLAAFMDFDMLKQFRSPWAGLRHFREILTMPRLLRSMANTLTMSALTLSLGTAAAILFALMLNEMRVGFFKRLVQTVSYLPFFLAWISVIGMVHSLYSLNGPLNDLVVLLSGDERRRTMFLALQKLFIPNALFLHLWKNVGWSSIIYLAAISGIDQQLYEAAYIDGANRLQQVRHVTLPGMKPTVIMLLILSIGGLVADNFELIYGLQNAYIDFDVIGTVIFEQGIVQGSYSLATAFGFAQGIIQLLLVLAANRLLKELSGVGLF